VVVNQIAPKLEAYICKEAMVRFCTEDYEKPSRENIDNVMMHLTNYSLNKQSSKFKKTQDIEN
jgi:hypothetical protein